MAMAMQVKKRLRVIVRGLDMRDVLMRCSCVCVSLTPTLSVSLPLSDALRMPVMSVPQWHEGDVWKAVVPLPAKRPVSFKVS